MVAFLFVAAISNESPWTRKRNWGNEMRFLSFRRPLVFACLTTIVAFATMMMSPAIGGVITSKSAITTYGFESISNNDSGDVAIGQSQLSVDVFGWNGSAATTDTAATSVLFRLRNAGPDASAIGRVYFEKGVLSELSGLIDADDHASFGLVGVDFETGKWPGPPNVPAWNDATPSFDTAFSTGAASPPPKNGVNPGEELGVIFDLNGNSVSNVLTSLNSGDARIGLHVQAFDSGGSESFVNSSSLGSPPGAPSAAPEPASLLVWGLGMVAGGGALHRRRRRAPAAS